MVQRVQHPTVTLLDEINERKYPDTLFVKAFSCVGHARMVNPTFTSGRPTMFYCGNDAGAKAPDELRSSAWNSDHSRSQP